jgi:hypothetical protein
MYFEGTPLKDVLDAIAKAAGLELRSWKDEGSRKVTIHVGSKAVNEAVVRRIDVEGVVMMKTMGGPLGPTPRGGQASRVGAVAGPGVVHEEHPGFPAPASDELLRS